MRLPPILLYVFRRLLIGLVVLFGISAVAFSMAYLLPSDPVTSRYPDITNEQRAEMRRQMGLDQPLVVQYARYMESVFRGEFGRSFGTGNSVAEDLAQRIPATLELASFGIAFGMLVGIPLGLLAAVRSGDQPLPRYHQRAARRDAAPDGARSAAGGAICALYGVSVPR